ncbi:MAG: hypothetical protein QF384_04105 [Alphaproteobacteria bacterium]|nr:hypothetical protein [Alphaproteobacteria bacterium]
MNGVTAADLRLAQSQTHEQGPADATGKDLPSVTVGPVPNSKSPTMVTEPGAKAGPAPTPRRSSAPRTLQLRLDPKTGQALTAEQLQERARRQVQPPRSLRAAQPQPSPAINKLAPAAGTAQTAPKAKSQADASGEAEGIQVKTLGQTKVSAIGLLSEAEGGFGANMWSGTPMAMVMNLLPRLPVAATSPTMQSLRRRLLVSTALPPDDVNGMDGDGSALVALRIQRLAAAGDSDAVAQLLKFAPLSANNSILAQVRVETELLAGNVGEACRIVRNQLGADEASDGGNTAGSAVAWQKIMAFCLALDGQTAQVELYEQLLYENGVEDEAFFALLANLNSGEAEPLERIARTEPLHLAMLRAARRAIPADAVKQASPAVLRAIATSPNATLPMRLQAAERAEALATLATSVLARVYASVPFSAEQSADALALAKRQPGPSASAILYQVAQIDAQIEGRARALAAAWRNGRRSGNYMTAVRINLDMTRTIAADPKLAWFAAAAGRALLAAGDREAARNWLMAILEPARAGEPEAAAALLTLAPLFYVAAGGQNDPALTPAMAKVLSGWWQGEVANGGAERYQRALRLYGLLAALGKDLPGELWVPLFEAPARDIPQASPSLLMGLERAAAGQRKGEVVLLSLLLLGERGPALSDTMTLGRVVAALRGIGLVEDAEAMALEGLLGAGF